MFKYKYLMFESIIVIVLCSIKLTVDLLSNNNTKSFWSFFCISIIILSILMLWGCIIELRAKK